MGGRSRSHGRLDTMPNRDPLESHPEARCSPRLVSKALGMNPQGPWRTFSDKLDGQRHHQGDGATKGLIGGGGDNGTEEAMARWRRGPIETNAGTAMRARRPWPRAEISVAPAHVSCGLADRSSSMAMH